LVRLQFLLLVLQEFKNFAIELLFAGLKELDVFLGLEITHAIAVVFLEIPHAVAVITLLSLQETSLAVAFGEVTHAVAVIPLFDLDETLFVGAIALLKVAHAIAVITFPLDKTLLILAVAFLKIAHAITVVPGFPHRFQLLEVAHAIAIVFLEITHAVAVVTLSFSLQDVPLEEGLDTGLVLLTLGLGGVGDIALSLLGGGRVFLLGLAHGVLKITSQLVPLLVDLGFFLLAHFLGVLELGGPKIVLVPDFLQKLGVILKGLVLDRLLLLLLAEGFLGLLQILILVLDLLLGVGLEVLLVDLEHIEFILVLLQPSFGVDVLPVHFGPQIFQHDYYVRTVEVVAHNGLLLAPLLVEGLKQLDLFLPGFVGVALPHLVDLPVELLDLRTELVNVLVARLNMFSVLFLGHLQVFATVVQLHFVVLDLALQRLDAGVLVRDLLLENLELATLLLDLLLFLLFHVVEVTSLFVVNKLFLLLLLVNVLLQRLHQIEHLLHRVLVL